MRSFLSVLPIVGLALAKEPCSQETVTKTLTNKITVTVPANTPTQYPTSAAEAEPTSTTVVEQTVVVTPSPVPWFPYPNGTFDTSIRYPTTLSTVALPTLNPFESAPAAEIPSSLAFPVGPLPTLNPYGPAPAIEVPSSLAVPISPSPTLNPYESAPAIEVPSSEAVPIPTSEYPAAPALAPEPVVESAATNSGEATFYGGNVAGGMCSFTGYTIPSGIFGTALSDSNWAGAGNCGACVSVKGPNGNTIKAMVVDQCPGCGNNHLDLFADAFAKLAAPSKGVIPVSWSIIPCGITSPIILKNKEGTSPYWFSMQVMNANVPVSKLEVSTDGGKSWKATTRKEYNYFENHSGFGSQSVDVKVTSTSGGSIVVKGVSIAANSKTTAASNFS